MVDIRELDGERLLASNQREDNVIAILARLGNQRHAVRRILDRIALANPEERGPAFAELMLLAGLRKLGKVIRQEASQMPILDDIMDHDVLGREFRRGLEKGREGVILRQSEKRFGPLPQWARERIESMTSTEVEEVALRLFDARSLEELFT